MEKYFNTIPRQKLGGKTYNWHTTWRRQNSLNQSLLNNPYPHNQLVKYFERKPVDIIESSDVMKWLKLSVGSGGILLPVRIIKLFDTRNFRYAFLTFNF